MSLLAEGNSSVQFEVDPYLSPETVTNLQAELVGEIRELGGQDAVYTVWMDSRGKYSNLIRTLETEIFPEMPDVMDDYEDDCMFLALVDTRADEERVVHAFRLSVPTEDRKDGLQIALLDDLVTSGQALTEKSLVDYYQERNISLNTQAVSVESNFRIDNKANPERRVEVEGGIRVSDLGYIALFTRLVEDRGAKVVFAHLNSDAIRSLSAIGVVDEPIAEHPELETPTVNGEEHGFDEKYRPVALMATPENKAVFQNLSLFAAPSVDL